MNEVLEYVGSPAPLWATGLLVLLAFAAGRLFRRARLLEERTARRAAQREARYATARAESAERAADAVTRALPAAAWPEPVSETLTTRGGSRQRADVLEDIAQTDETDETGGGDLDPFAQEEWANRSVRAAYRADAASLRHGAGQPDEEQRDTELSAGPTVTFAAVLPRYDWSATGWTPGAPAPSPQPGPAPLLWGRGLDLLRRATVSLWAPVRWVRWSLAGWSWRAAARAEARELAQAVQLLGGPDPGTAGELTGETTLLPVVGRAVVPKPPLPRSHLPVHVWGRRLRMVSVAAVLGRKPAGLAGRHRPEVVPGAVAQRQTRLLALPAGAS